MNEKFNWLKGGLLLGAVFLAAVWLVKPIGVSTQFVVIDGIVWDFFSPNLIEKNEAAKHRFSSTNAYIDKSGGKLASEIKNPINYEFLFVLSMVFGGALSGWLSKKKISKIDRVSPAVWRNKFGADNNKRYLYAFFAGFVVLFGARLADGCTSGHMMSGMMQTSVSGYLFAAGAFATAIPIAILFFKPRKH